MQPFARPVGARGASELGGKVLGNIGRAKLGMVGAKLKDLVERLVAAVIEPGHAGPGSVEQFLSPVVQELIVKVGVRSGKGSGWRLSCRCRSWTKWTRTDLR